MLDFIKNHWQVIFSGIGTAIVAAVLGLALRRKAAASRSQTAKAGKSSQIVQAGRNATVGSTEARKGDQK